MPATKPYVPLCHHFWQCIFANDEHEESTYLTWNKITLKEANNFFMASLSKKCSPSFISPISRNELVEKLFIFVGSIWTWPITHIAATTAETHFALPNCSHPLFGIRKRSASVYPSVIFFFNAALLRFFQIPAYLLFITKQKSYGLFAGRFNFYWHTTKIIEGLIFRATNRLLLDRILSFFSFSLWQVFFACTQSWNM